MQGRASVDNNYIYTRMFLHYIKMFIFVVDFEMQTAISTTINQSDAHDTSSPDDASSEAVDSGRIYRSMSLMELSTRIWDTETSTYNKGTGSVIKYTTDILPPPGEWTMNDTSEPSVELHQYNSAELSPTLDQYTFHM